MEIPPRRELVGRQEVFGEEKAWQAVHLRDLQGEEVGQLMLRAHHRGADARGPVRAPEQDLFQLRQRQELRIVRQQLPKGLFSAPNLPFSEEKRGKKSASGGETRCQRGSFARRHVPEAAAVRLEALPLRLERRRQEPLRESEVLAPGAVVGDEVRHLHLAWQGPKWSQKELV